MAHQKDSINWVILKTLLLLDVIVVNTAVLSIFEQNDSAGNNSPIPAGSLNLRYDGQKWGVSGYSCNYNRCMRNCTATDKTRCVKKCKCSDLRNFIHMFLPPNCHLEHINRCKNFCFGAFCKDLCHVEHVTSCHRLT